jgi:hypothetical protein
LYRAPCTGIFLPNFFGDIGKFGDIEPEILARVVKEIIPDQIFYPNPLFLPIFCLNLRKKGMENPRKSHPF